MEVGRVFLSMLKYKMAKSVGSFAKISCAHLALISAAVAELFRELFNATGEQRAEDVFHVRAVLRFLNNPIRVGLLKTTGMDTL